MDPMTTGTMLETTQIKYGINKQFSLMHWSTSDTTLKKIPSLSYLLTYSIVQSPSWEANWFAASQEIPHI